MATQHIKRPIISAGDADYILTTTDMTTAGSQATMTNDNLPWGPGKLELSKSSTGAAVVYLTYKRASGAVITEEKHSFTAASGTYTDHEVADLETVRWEALAENLTIGQITKLWFYIGDEYTGNDDGVYACFCQVSNSSCPKIATKDTNWGYDEATKCAWILVSAITSNATDVIFNVLKQ